MQSEFIRTVLALDDQERLRTQVARFGVTKVAGDLLAIQAAYQEGAGRKSHQW
jgi:hypothetical protein